MEGQCEGKLSHGPEKLERGHEHSGCFLMLEQTFLWWTTGSILVHFLSVLEEIVYSAIHKWNGLYKQYYMKLVYRGLVILTDFPSMFYHYWKTSDSNCSFMYFFLYFYQFLLHVFWSFTIMYRTILDY